MASYWLQENTWEEVAQRREEAKGVVLIPVGSTEQHGPHLPVGADTMVAIALAEDAAQQTGVLIAPPLWIGWSPHHLVLPGTISARAEVLIELLYDVILSLNRHGFRGFVVINGHRIVNIPWMQIAAERAQRELGVRVMIFDPAYMSREIVDGLGFGSVGHAEEIESSHMWYRYPHLVKMDKAADYRPAHRPLYHVDPRATADSLCYVPSTARDMERVAQEGRGVAGNPTRSSPEKGKVYHEHLVSRLVQVIRNLQGA